MPQGYLSTNDEVLVCRMLIDKVRLSFFSPTPPPLSHSSLSLILIMGTSTRHPDPSVRPTFTSIVETMKTLGSNIQDCWTDGEKAQNSLALVLGSPLHFAENLYPDLQHIYERTRTQTI